MKEYKIRGVVTGLRANNTWNTHQVRWFNITVQTDVEDMADDRKITQTNMDIVCDDPSKLPQIGDIVITTVQMVPIEDREPPPDEEEIVQYGDEVALADPEDDEIQGNPDYESIKQGG